jgi:hypothetical protein
MQACPLGQAFVQSSVPPQLLDNPARQMLG